ncbi:HflX GTPase family protein [Micromonospora sp. NPDC050187]|uniref:HflX GTPase family protein n=1 Tax=Micromonospora sp. NPDC050187 TaxID=3364277 RepID=UPI0037ACA29C
MRRLADTDGLRLADAVVRSRPRPDPATFVGSGKADELAGLAARAHSDLVIADGELSPGQTRNLEERIGVTRSRRARNQVPSVAITGYTNAGKSALLNRLTGADAQVRDVLFATLDPTVRRISTGEHTYTVTDTVGFVRHLPHQLVDAFRSTLEEVSRSDLVLHVVDASAPDALDQITTVHGVLHEIGAGGLPELLVLNKIDVAPPEWVDALCRAHPDAVAVSALTGAGADRLRAALATRLAGRRA